MKYSLLLATGCLILAIACNKDKLTTIPQYRIESISPETVNSGDVLTIRGSYTDKEGDIDSVFVVRKFFSGDTETDVDTVERIRFAELNLPPATTEAELNIRYEYNTGNTGLRVLSGVTKDTTIAFGVILQDKTPNRSLYQESPKVRLIKF
jgi:hypothetical protein